MVRSRFIIILLLIATLAGGFGHADIQWFVSIGNAVAGPDLVTLLQGHFNDPSFGFFSQLLDSGANMVPDLALNTGNGASSDDMVVATRWMGAGTSNALHALLFDPSPNTTNVGFFAAGSPFAGNVENNKYFVRVWSGISPDINLVLNADPAAGIPNNPGVQYADSGLFVDPGDGGGGAGINDLDASFPSGHTNLLPIPEPTMLALIGGGLLTLYYARRIAKRASTLSCK